MLKAMVIDDEPMSVKRLTLLLEETGMIKVNDGFTDPEEALASGTAHRMDLAFVDIEMPGMTGLLLTEKLLKQNATLDIIIVTAHDQYALEAFQTYASGYLLKPVSKEDITRQLTVIMGKRQGRQDINDEPVLTIHTFGQFQCSIGEVKRDYFQWRTLKTRELMAFLHYHQGSPVHRDTIVDHLWPEMDLDRGIKNFHATAYYLRETLKKKKLDYLLEGKNGNYRLKWDRIISDEKIFAEGIHAMVSGKYNLTQLQDLVEIHQQAYCGIDDFFWADDRRRYYEHMYLQALEKISEGLDKLSDDTCKVQLLLQIIRQDPYNEVIHEKIIDVFLNQQKVEEARHHLKDMERCFQEELGIDPPRHLYRKVAGNEMKAGR